MDALELLGNAQFVPESSDAFRIAGVRVGGRTLILVSSYALFDYPSAGGPATYAITSLHRTLSDLTPILDLRLSRLPVLLGGAAFG